jgi:hypothetical protein
MLHSILPMFHTARVDPDRFLCVRIISNRISLDKLQLRALGHAMLHDPPTAESEGRKAAGICERANGFIG